MSPWRIYATMLSFYTAAWSSGGQPIVLPQQQQQPQEAILTAKQLASTTIEWPECPAWIAEYALRHKQAIQGWGMTKEGRPAMKMAMMHDCSDEVQINGCHCGIGDRMRAAMETLKVSFYKKVTYI